MISWLLVEDCNCANKCVCGGPFYPTSLCTTIDIVFYLLILYLMWRLYVKLRTGDKKKNENKM